VERIEALNCRTWSTIVFPIGFLIAADIVLSNTAILYLPLSLVTSIKGSNLIFTFLWGILIEIEKFQFNLLLAVLGISFGLGIAVANSLQANLLGVLLALSAACAGGLRWALLQLLETKDPQSKSVMVTLYRFTPASVMSILPLFITIEADKLYSSTFWTHWKDMDDALLLCIFGGVFAFCLVVVEVKLVRLTSALTMSVFGQVKELIQISLAMMLFRENLSMKSGIGIGVSILSSIYYRYVILQKKDSPMPPFPLKSSKSEETLNLLEETETATLSDDENQNNHNHHHSHHHSHSHSHKHSHSDNHIMSPMNIE
jgi:solute carrier family 35, member C2